MNDHTYSLSTYFWLIPFGLFAFGYFLMALLYPAKEIVTPALIGKPLNEAVQIASDNNLNIRVIAKKQEKDLPEGTILSQMPSASSRIKHNQSIYCVISTKPALPIVPNFINQHKNRILPCIQEQKLRTKIFYVESKYPKDTCIAQYPTPGNNLKEQTALIVYLSSGNNKQIVWPNFKGICVTAVEEFLSIHDIKPSINHTHFLEPHHTCTDQCIVVDQRPLAGSILALQEQSGLSVQLQVKTMQI